MTIYPVYVRHFIFVCTVAPKIMNIIKKGAHERKLGFTASIMHIVGVRRRVEEATCE